MKKKKYIPIYRRRREGRTDYKKRLALLKGNKYRLVVRKSLKNMTVQIVKYHPDGDIIVASANTKELSKYGWKSATGNIPAAYLVGYLTGMKAKDIKEAVVDIGIYPVTKASRLFAVVKGCRDAGVEIPCDEEILPDDERTKGAHIESNAERLRNEDKAGYEKYFSQYLKAGQKPEEIGKNIDDVLNNIKDKK